MALPLLLALVAAQGGEPLAFAWSAPPACPPRSSLQARLGGGLAGTASAAVTETAEGFHLRVEVEGAVRELWATTCEEAADAAVLIVRLALTPKPPAPPPAALPEPPAPPPAPPPGRAQWRGRAGALAAFDFLWLPQPLVRLGATLQLQRGPLAVVVDGTSSLPLRFRGGPTPDAAVSLQVPFALEAGACWLFDVGPLRGGPCLTGGPTWLSARGENVSDPRQTTVVLWSGGPGARAAMALGRVFELSAAAGVRFGGRPAVSFEGWAPVVEGGAVDFSLSAGVGARF